jgi:hypothetical protein
VAVRVVWVERHVGVDLCGCVCVCVVVCVCGCMCAAVCV